MIKHGSMAKVALARMSKCVEGIAAERCNLSGSVLCNQHLAEACFALAHTSVSKSRLIKAWVAIVKQVRWHNFPEVRSTFKDADNVKGYVIFDIRKNRYRLVTVIHYAKTTNHVRTQGHVYIRSFLTHKEYDNPANWDRKFGTK